MSNLVNDFLIEPVLRRARHFSRSNVQDQQSSLVCRSDITSENPAGQSETPQVTQTNISKDTDSKTLAFSGSSATIPSSLTSGENDNFESIFQAGENVELSTVPRSSRNVISFRVPELSESGYNEYAVGDAEEQTESDENLSALGSRSESQADASTGPSTEPSLHQSEEAVTNVIECLPSRPEASEGPAQNAGAAKPTTLPEDDGMGDLRREILAIQAMDIRDESKAHLIHQLLTRNYTKAQMQSSAKKQKIAHTPSIIIKQERSIAPGSLSYFLWQLNCLLDPTAEEQNYIYKLSTDDLKRTYVPSDCQECEDVLGYGSQDGPPDLGCKHYKRNVKLQCSACEKWYTCRLCHDEVEDHILDRKATRNMLCMICGCAQKAGEFCLECGERTAWYYCHVCKLWDNDSSKSIYHCHDCGICRKGLGIGKDFFHCKTCGTCMPMSVEQSHTCIERVSQSDCPICGEYMFTSQMRVVYMLCGHAIHKACYDEHLKTSYKCPLCSKSTINMETQFRNLDRAIITQPMPPQFRDTKVMVSCNDCCAKSAVKFHWLGLKCAICGSYNTAQISAVRDSAGISANQEASSSIPPINSISRYTSSPSHSRPSMMRPRRHSTYINQGDSRDRNRISEANRPSRISRSISPTRGTVLLFDDASEVMESDDSTRDGESDMWGLDELRSITSDENIEDEIEDEDSDDDSILEDCDDDGEEEEDEFALFGHR